MFSEANLNRITRVAKPVADDSLVGWLIGQGNVPRLHATVTEIPDFYTRIAGDSTTVMHRGRPTLARKSVAPAGE